MCVLSIKLLIQKSLETYLMILVYIYIYILLGERDAQLHTPTWEDVALGVVVSSVR